MGALAGCGGSDDPEVRGSSFERPSTAPPVGVVEPDDPASTAPGDLIAAHPLGREVVPPGAIGWEIVYRSLDAHDQPIEVTGVVYAPDAPAPAPDGGRPVFTWAHGPTGMADRCAPTRVGVAIPYVNELIQSGFVVVATDYEGLGTPGPHPFLVGSSAAHTVLDIVRAAVRLEVTGAGNRVLAGGHFQGGHAVLFAGMHAAAYAPELELLGIVAGVPTAETDLVFGGTAGLSNLFGYFAMAATGYAETYDDLALDDLLTEDAIERLEVLKTGCTPEIIAEFADTPTPELLVQPPQASKPWVARIAENRVVHGAIEAPLLILHGTKDEIIPVQISDALVANLCEAGRTLDYRRVSGDRHLEIYETEGPEVLGWLDDRLNREPAESTC